MFNLFKLGIVLPAVALLLVACTFTRSDSQTLLDSHHYQGGVYEEFSVWEGQAPGTDWGGDERDSQNESDSGFFHVKTNVTEPTLTVFRPAPDKANGSAMLVLPGGAFAALAWDMEGLEVAQWLADRGITAFVLKYRVRPADVILAGREPPKTFEEYLPLLESGRKIAVADASQAMRLVRGQAAQYGLDPKKIGMIGFSAGAAATMGVVLEGEPEVRPDFAAPIYGMTMINVEPPSNAPPLFIVAAQDDKVVPVENSIKIFEQWTKADHSAALHLYTQGGHGFGVRSRGLPIDDWPQAFESWLKSKKIFL